MIVSGIEQLSRMENSEVAYKTMLGDAQQAKALAEDMMTFANTTPFTFEDLDTGARNLIALGVNANKVIPTLQSVGDAVATMGEAVNKSLR